MKALAWYSVVFSILVIIAFILFLVGVIAEPPFTTSEAVVWAVLTIPVVVLGIMVIRKKE
ncbi:MAG TPA: hypothetical protein VJ377_11155 [Dehalococcoidales bacterium]|nr:MAG: hypothetical protein A2Z05_07910 [Chloroflexi bacterium RBG_16_60_22]HJX14067.1 hypothetical protein [Dehalococcoidales bacterium]